MKERKIENKHMNRSELENNIKKIIIGLKKWFKSFFSLKGKIGRLGFLLTLLCVLVMTDIFCYLTKFLWHLYDPFPCLKFNIYVWFGLIFGLLGILSGLLPITALILIDCTILSLEWGNTFGYGFFVEAIVMDALFVLYVLQCCKRCRDLDVSFWNCIVPLYNPIAFLLCPGDRSNELLRHNELEFQ